LEIQEEQLMLYQQATAEDIERIIVERASPNDRLLPPPDE